MSQTVDDPHGDLLIDLSERQFGLADAAYLSRIAQGSIRNWLARGQLKISRRTHPTGRYLLSFDDVLRLVVMHDLCGVRMALNPLDAADIAEVVVQKARDSTAPGSLCPNVNVLVGRTEDGKVVIGFHDITEPGHYRPPPSDGSYNPLRRAHICIPCRALLIDLALRTQALETANRKAEAPFHV